MKPTRLLLGAGGAVALDVAALSARVAHAALGALRALVGESCIPNQSVTVSRLTQQQTREEEMYLGNRCAEEKRTRRLQWGEKIIILYKTIYLFLQPSLPISTKMRAASRVSRSLIMA